MEPKTVNYTATELAAKLGVEYATAAALLKLMVAQGAAKEVEKRKTATGKGKPSTVYSVPESFTINFAA